MITVQPPIDLKGWIEENADKFRPPVSNCYLYDGRDFFVMVIKGPNARNDFHLVDSEEYFYQLKGDIKVRIRQGDRIVDHIVHEGETFFVPSNVPHSPQRQCGRLRSEEHTSELQSRPHLVCRLLLEKKKARLYNIVILYYSTSA